MANVTITIPDAIVPRLIAAMDATFPQYNALSDAAAFKQITADYWRGILSAYEEREAEKAAQAANVAAIAAARSKAATDGAGIG